MNNFLSFKVTSSTGRFLALLVALACWLPSRGQQAKTPLTLTPLQLAEQYYAAGEYYTAATLYGQHLNPSKKNSQAVPFTVYAKKRTQWGPSVKGMSRADILFKQAESYRLANYLIAADSTYKKCTEIPEALYWQAVCKRSLGKYDEAEENIINYLSTAGANSPLKETAAKELQTLQFIRKQLARADSVLVTVKKLNTLDGFEKGAFAAVSVSGNQYLVSSTQTDTVQIKGTNPHHSRLFYATKTDDSLAQFAPIALSSAGPLDNQGAATISADSNHLYFTQWKYENGHTVSSIYYTAKQNGGWTTPVILPQVNAGGFNSKQPFCSADGKYLFFSSDRPGGSGKFDIWYAPLKDDGTTGTPVNAGTVINTTDDEQAPFYHKSTSTLVFSTNGRQGMGGYDLFSAKGSEATWTMPDNLGHPVNSSRDDIYFFAPEKTNLLANAVIGSDRGTGCCLETYSIKKAAKNKRLRGFVLDCKNNSPVANAAIILKDASGNSRTSKTDSVGKYIFESIGDMIGDLTLTTTRELYKDKASAVIVNNTDETDLLTDLLFNADLCLDKKLVIKAEDVVTIYFDFDKSILKPVGIHKLDSIVKVMAQNPNTTIQISGYTDGKGTDEYNAKLSDRRARACADFLIKKGIDSSRVTFESFGECCPVEMEIINGRDNPDGRSRNRRAMINVKKD